MLQHPLQYTATRTAPYCNTLQQHSKSWRDCRYNTLQHSPHHTVTLTASHCNTHCNTHCNNTSDLGAILGREILTKCHFEGYILKRRLYIHMMRERERERDRARERERERTRERERERERERARGRERSGPSWSRSLYSNTQILGKGTCLQTSFLSAGIQGGGTHTYDIFGTCLYIYGLRT